MTTTYAFKKGDKVHLDSIYDVQGLGEGRWWEAIEEDGDDLIIQEDIEITIIIKQ